MIRVNLTILPCCFNVYAFAKFQLLTGSCTLHSRKFPASHWYIPISTCLCVFMGLHLNSFSFPSFFALGFRDLTIDQLLPQISTSLLYQTIPTGKGFTSAAPPAIKSAQTIPWILGIFEYIYSHLNIFLVT